MIIVPVVLVIVAITLHVLVKVFAVITLGRCTSKQKLHGKTALVTGSNRGVGYYTALDLASRGARVILTCINIEDGQKARDKIIARTGNTNVVVKHLDLRYFKNIRHFAEDILKTEKQLDILVNNAGALGFDTGPTEDDLPAGMQINHYGPFLLTNLLLGLLKESSPSRIVNVGSCMCQFSICFNENNINSSFETLRHATEYSNSKLCVLLTTFEMSKRLAGTGVTVNCLHPGAVFSQTDREPKWDILKLFYYTYGLLYFKNAEEGAQTSIYLAVDEKVTGVTGKYFSDCRVSTPWVKINEQKLQKVWHQSTHNVHLSSEEMYY
ncbi:uncharacterized protein CBL_02456 [Carabus blaptoides fortunei]